MTNTNTESTTQAWAPAASGWGSPFGRRAVSDPRDLWYLLADRDPDPRGINGTAEQVRQFRGPIYDQRDRPTGVACALLSHLHASPLRLGPGRCPSVETLDQQIREVEGALGHAVTLRSGCRALKQLGLIREYAWSYDVDEVIAYLTSGQGGLTLALDWYAAMSRPDERGLIRCWGKPEGGHAVFVWGIDTRDGMILLQNNWGTDWGGWSAQAGQRDFQGCARLPLEDLKKLLADNAEAVALTKHPAPVPAPVPAPIPGRAPA